MLLLHNNTMAAQLLVPMMKLSDNTSLYTEYLAGCLEMHFLEILIWFHLIALPLRLCAAQ